MRFNKFKLLSTVVCCIITALWTETQCAESESSKEEKNSSPQKSFSDRHIEAGWDKIQSGALLAGSAGTAYSKAQEIKEDNSLMCMYNATRAVKPVLTTSMAVGSIATTVGSVQAGIGYVAKAYEKASEYWQGNSEEKKN